MRDFWKYLHSPIAEGAAPDGDERGNEERLPLIFGVEVARYQSVNECLQNEACQTKIIYIYSISK